MTQLINIILGMCRQTVMDIFYFKRQPKELNSVGSDFIFVGQLRFSFVTGLGPHMHQHVSELCLLSPISTSLPLIVTVLYVWLMTSCKTPKLESVLCNDDNQKLEVISACGITVFYALLFFLGGGFISLKKGYQTSTSSQKS